MIKTLLLLTAISCGTLCFCDTPDSSLYVTNFERDVFQSVSKKLPIDTIDLFVALSYQPGSDAKQKVSRFTSELKSRIADLPVNKKIKTAYKAVHEKFFSKYNEEAFFNDIFINGNYNCVSASALYALILEELGIRYTIKETPVHVYLIADPGNTGFLIESTLPGEKIIQFDERYKSQYIEYLHNNKIISDNEFSKTSIDELFNKYYSKDKTISIKQLAGLQYYNQGVFLYNKAAYDQSLASFEKAELLYDEDIIKYMKNNSLINLLNKETQQKKFRGDILGKYITANDSNSAGIQFGNEYFKAVSAELIVNHPDVNAYKKYFQQLSGNLKGRDSNEIYQTYYFFLSYLSNTNYNYPEALSYLTRAYKINPENISTKQLVLESITKYLVNDRNHNKSIDSIEYYITVFPFLKKDNTLINFLDYCYASSISEFFGQDDFEDGNRRMAEYEDFLKDNPDFEPNKNNLGLIYQQIGFYYLRKQQYDQAEQSLRKGIRMSPDAGELKGMLRSVMLYRGGSYEYPELMDDSNPMKNYLLAIARAKDNQSTINDNSGKYLVRQWILSKRVKNGTEIKDPEIEKIVFTLTKDNQVKYTAASDTTNGMWNYDSNRCLLNLTVEKEKLPLHIIITSITSDYLKGVMYMGNDYKNSTAVVFKGANDRTQ